MTLNKQLTEKDIVDWVCNHGKYIGGEYFVEWTNGAFQAKDTRSLVVKICNHEGIPVRG